MPEEVECVGLPGEVAELLVDGEGPLGVRRARRGGRAPWSPRSGPAAPRPAPPARPTPRPRRWPGCSTRSPGCGGRPPGRTGRTSSGAGPAAAPPRAPSAAASSRPSALGDPPQRRGVPVEPALDLGQLEHDPGLGHRVAAAPVGGPPGRRRRPPRSSPDLLRASPSSSWTDASSTGVSDPMPPPGREGPLVELGGLEVGVDALGPSRGLSEYSHASVEPLGVEVVERQELGLGSRRRARVLRCARPASRWMRRRWRNDSPS